ncbi:MAG TPA: sulfotransferase [Methylibium sp.]|nr:sulfotransferase [Methylibium sp.]
MIIFIVGTPRSGTSAVLEQLATQLHAYAGPETHVFRKAPSWWDLRRRALRGFLGRCRQIYFKTRIGPRAGDPAIADAFRRLEREYGVVIEKTPDHLQQIGRIRRVLPDAVFVHCVREPGALTRSFYVASRQSPRLWPPSSLDEIQRKVCKDLAFHQRWLGQPGHLFVRFEAHEADIRQHLPHLPQGRCREPLQLSLPEEVWRTRGFTASVNDATVPTPEVCRQGECGEQMLREHQALLAQLRSLGLGSLR